MGILMPRVVMYHAKQMMRRRSKISCENSSTLHVPKGHFAIYVREEEEKKRFVVPVSYLKYPSFQELLRKAEEEFGYDHGMGGLTVPCTECYFIDLLSRLNGCTPDQ